MNESLSACCFVYLTGCGVVRFGGLFLPTPAASTYTVRAKDWLCVGLCLLPAGCCCVRLCFESCFFCGFVLWLVILLGCALPHTLGRRRRACTQAHAQNAIVKFEKIDMSFDALAGTVLVHDELVKKGKPCSCL